MNEPQNNARNEQTPIMQPYYMPAPYADDEINLLDLWLLLSSYKALFLKTMLPIIVLGLLYVVFIAKESYELTTTIQIGSYKAANDFVAIESPESLLSKIQSSIEPIFTTQWKNKNEIEGFINTALSNPKNSNIITVKNKVNVDDIELFKNYQLALTESIVDDHKNLIVALQAVLLSQLEIANLKLQELQTPLFLAIKLKAIEIDLDAEKIKLKKLKDKEFFGIKKNQFKNKIISAKHKLDLSIDQALVIKKKLLNLDETKKTIKKNIGGLEALINVAHKNKNKSLAKATELSAMSLLLINSDIQQNQNRLLTLEERYYVGLKNERSTLNAELNSNAVDQINQQNDIAILDEKLKELTLVNELDIAQQQLSIDKIELNIEKTKFHTNNEVAKQKQSIIELKTELDNYNLTRMVAEPAVSQKPVGLSKKLSFMLLVFMAGFIAFLMVLRAVFIDKIKLRQLDLANDS